MKNISCSLGRSSFGTFLVILLSFLVLSLLVQSCRLNQNVLVQAASMNQRGQRETNRLYSPDHEGTDKPSFKSSIPQSEISNPPSVNSNPSNPQSTIQNLSSTSTGDPKSAFLNPQSKAAVIRKTAKLQMPFIANNGQMDEKVKFYANTFGGTVFVTINGEIVYSLPNNSSDIETQCLASLMHSPKGMRDKVGMLHDYYVANIMHPASWIVDHDSKSEFQNPQSTSSNFSNPKSEICGPKSTISKIQPFKSVIRNPQSEIQGVALNEDVSPRPLRERDRVRGVSLKEEFVGAKVKTIQGEEKSVTNVNYFKGKDPSKWKTNISAYDIVNLGEVYKGIELKLKAYGNNVEKLFCVKPGADPGQIKVGLSSDKDCGMQNAECGNNTPLSPLSRGDKSEFGNPKLSVNTHGEPDVGWVKRSAPNKQLLLINERGELEVETELGPVKFTKPIAYQEIDGKRVAVECGYVIADCGLQHAECKTHLKPEAGNQRQEAVGWVKRSAPNKNGLNQLNGQESKGKRQISSREKGMGRKGKYLASNQQLSIQNLSTTSIGDSQSAIHNPNSKIKDPSPAIRHSSPTYSFTVASYDKTKNLIIDPLLASTFLGGSSGENAYSIAINSSGNIYITGQTYSSDFPITGAYNDSYSGGGDVFVSKLDGNLTTLIASTYVGGSYGDEGYSIAVNSSGNIFVTGDTKSSDFPITTGVYDISYNGGNTDAFILRLNGNLTSLLASTYLGGSYDDHGNSIVIDTNENIYITGHTQSSNFPTTTGAYDTSWYSYPDVFISKLSNDLTNLLSSTYLGGSDYDYGYSIALDTSGNVYVTGSTSSTDFPTASGAYDISYNGGGYDVFISKLDGGLISLLASTYLGGSDYDYSYSTAFDTNGNIYVTGQTYSSDFPTTGSYDDSYSGSGDVFVSKLGQDLTTVNASTYLGGSSYDCGYSITIDTSGNVYVTGYTESSNFPTTTGSYDTSLKDESDGFVSKVKGDLTSLLAGTYLGGYSSDSGRSIAIDSSGNIYITGTTVSSDFPTTTGAYDTSLFSQDAFVSKFDNNLYASSPTATTEAATNITTTSATLNGTVNGNGLSTTVWFEYDTNSGSYNDVTATYGVSGSDEQSVSISISRLSSGTTYYYRLGARTDSGSTYGSEKSFETLENMPPSVITGNATSVTKDSAILDGAVNANGLSTAAWFEYGTYSGSYTNTSSTQSVSGTTDSTVSINISELSSGTTYFYRIVAQNSAGTSYGSEKSFKTVTDTTKLPKVTTGSATSVTSNSAKLDGTVNANNLETYAWFEYGTKSGSYGSVSSTQKLTGTSDTTVSISISGISSATKYYYRIAAQNNSGTSYGSEKSFSTLDTSAPTGSISINGDATYTESISVTLTLSATDNAGLTGYYISTSSTTPSASAAGWTSVTSTTSYNENVSYTLSSDDGNKTVYAWFKDASGNISSTASDSIILDTTIPTITINSPTSDDTYTTTSNVIAIGGTASDTTSGISSITWANDKGGSGTASGITSWLTSSISLLSGENIITVTATDGAGNTSTDKITVIYNTGTVSTPTPTLTPVTSPTPILTPTTEPSEKGIISGYVINAREYPIESAKIRLKGVNSKILKKTSDEDGLFEFTDLEADTYIITAIKKGYKRVKQTITLEAGEDVDIEIVMKRTSKKGTYFEN